jgi:hypothetical protein
VWRDNWGKAVECLAGFGLLFFFGCETAFSGSRLDFSGGCIWCVFLDAIVTESLALNGFFFLLPVRSPVIFL